HEAADAVVEGVVCEDQRTAGGADAIPSRVVRHVALDAVSGPAHPAGLAADRLPAVAPGAHAEAAGHAAWERHAVLLTRGADERDVARVLRVRRGRPVHHRLSAIGKARGATRADGLEQRRGAARREERGVHAGGALERGRVRWDAEVAGPHEGWDGRARLAGDIRRDPDRPGDDRAGGPESLDARPDPGAGSPAVERAERPAVVHEGGDVAGAEEGTVGPPFAVPPTGAADHRDAHAAAPGRAGARGPPVFLHASCSWFRPRVQHRPGRRPWWRAAAGPR